MDFTAAHFLKSRVDVFFPLVIGRRKDNLGAAIVLDMAFLNRACWRSFRLPLLLPVIDTMAIEKRSLDHKHIPLVRNALRLSSCCTRYGLPPGTVHNALSDALATAQLLLAQVAHKGGRVRLEDLL